MEILAFTEGLKNSSKAARKSLKVISTWGVGGFECEQVTNSLSLASEHIPLQLEEDLKKVEEYY